MKNTLRALTLLPLFSLAVGPLYAQDASRLTGASESAARLQAPDSPLKNKAKTSAVPSLYDGEAEDIGPQLLLMEKPPHDWFLALADLQNYYTSNATLVESGRTWSDVSVITAQAGVNAKPFSFASGKLAVSTGYRYQKFSYGLLSGRTNHDIAGSTAKLDELDFDTHTGFLNADWKSGDFTLGTGVRYSAYIARPTDKTTYQEWAPSINAGYKWTLSERDFVTLGADADYRFTHTHAGTLVAQSFGLDFNDRFDVGLNIAYSHIFGESLLVQPSYRVQYSRYTEGSASVSTGPGREDLYHILSMTVGYYFNDNFSARLFGSAEFRESDRDTVADYNNFNVGAGVMAMISF